MLQLRRSLLTDQDDIILDCIKINGEGDLSEQLNREGVVKGPADQAKLAELLSGGYLDMKTS